MKQDGGCADMRFALEGQNAGNRNSATQDMEEMSHQTLEHIQTALMTRKPQPSS